MAASARLSDLCELIVDCPHSTPAWTESGVIVLRNQNIRNGRLDLSDPSYTDEAHYAERTGRATPTAGDLVITAAGHCSGAGSHRASKRHDRLDGARERQGAPPRAREAHST